MTMKNVLIIFALTMSLIGWVIIAMQNGWIAFGVFLLLYARNLGCR